MAAPDLQRQCHDLLNQLKVNQVTLRQGLSSACGVSSLENNLETRLTENKPGYARQKLKSIMKNKKEDSVTANGFQPISSVAESKALSTSLKETTIPSALRMSDSKSDELQEGVVKEGTKRNKHGRPTLVQGEKAQQSDTDAMQDYFQSRTTDSLMEGGTDSFSGLVSSEDNARPHVAGKPTTPTSVRRRRIIDRNVHVDSKLSDAELQELEKDTRGLNFSYSQNIEDEDRLKTDEQEQTMEDIGEERKQTEVRTEDSDLTYQKYLVDRGNNRQLSNFIRDTTIKPKTILNSTQSFSSNYSKQGPGVSFQSASSTSGNSSLFRSQTKERRLLGYDWIAALVNNDAGLMDESESYFHELREFRRCNRDECCNDFYMEGPFSLTETEPPAVEKAIKDTKVQPFTVNERLFTVPVTEDLLGRPLDTSNKDKAKEEPTQDNPRFVRVSIPRSTLQMPYKVQPHRRRSFDASDSCSLNEHCLMGWNAVSPATLPTASGISLTDATAGVNPKHTTTMAEAEKAASMFHWPLLTEPKSRLDSLPNWRKQYMDTTLNFVHPDSSSLSLSSSLEGGRRGVTRSGNVQRKTDELLSSTYSMMYEMQKAREKREQEQLRQSGKMAS